MSSLKCTLVQHNCPYKKGNFGNACAEKGVVSRHRGETWKITHSQQRKPTWPIPWLKMVSIITVKPHITVESCQSPKLCFGKPSKVEPTPIHLLTYQVETTIQITSCSLCRLTETACQMFPAVLSILGALVTELLSSPTCLTRQCIPYYPIVRRICSLIFTEG